ncbi:MAG: M20 family metallopeptidase [Chitinophagales bacterium]|nr:M20 family metallopeptidase [Chitinophagales bacterium]
MSALKNTIQGLSHQIFPEVVAWRQHLHKYPELSFQEYETAAFVSQKLSEWGIEHQTQIAKTGIVALIKGKDPTKKCVALRADMDALPINEQNTLDYTSINQGVMHACGHDVHTANLLGVAWVLKQLENEIEGTYKLIFQPSEEKLPSGAEAMIKEGVLENPKVDYILGQHVSPELKTGTFGFCAGQFMASADEIYLTVKGTGGHAAFPHLLNDTVLCASAIVVNMQQVVSRKKSPFEAGVLSFGKIIANGATNIIPSEVELAGTLRAFNEDFRNEAHTLIKSIAENTATTYGCQCVVNIVKGSPSLFNNEELTLKKEALAKEYGNADIKTIPPRMGGEDFAWYSQKVPALFYRVGTGNKDKNTEKGLHNHQFNIDEDALKESVGMMVWLAVN